MFPFHTIYSANFTAGSQNFLLSPNAFVSSRGLIEADAWAHFRVKAFAFRLHPVNASTVLQAAGYVGGIEDTQPSSVVQIGELLPSTALADGTTVPTEWVRPSKAELAGPLPWYKTIPGTADPTEESPGIVCVAGGTTELFIIEMRGLFEFKTAVAVANTPAALQAVKLLREERVRAVLEHERASLLKVLASPPVIASTSFK
jgi:hypothetical protein